MMKIYVACLASYNNGTLHGDWFDLEDFDGPDDLYDAVKEQVLITSLYPNVEVDCPRCGGDGIHTYDPDGICSQCKGSGEVPSAEEWAIHDHEGFPDDSVGEYTSFEKLFELKDFMEEAEGAFGTEAEEIVAAFARCFGSATVEQIQDAYVGEYNSTEDFCQERWIDYGKIEKDSDLFPYIDWDYVWNGDLRHSYAEHNGHYFRSDW